jgi:hypothetical protein
MGEATVRRARERQLGKTELADSAQSLELMRIQERPSGLIATSTIAIIIERYEPVDWVAYALSSWRCHA